jgi:predicted nucleic acid-binding Zn ribbon protein
MYVSAETFARAWASQAQVVAGLSASLTALLSERGVAAAPAGESPDLILRCVVRDARSGSKLKRIVIGLGAGQARLQLQVSLIEPRINQQPILSQLKTYFAAQGWAYREPVLTAAAR